jgi:hypothetical protein
MFPPWGNGLAIAGAVEVGDTAGAIVEYTEGKGAATGAAYVSGVGAGGGGAIGGMATASGVYVQTVPMSAINPPP